MKIDSNCITSWLPRLEAAGLPTPRTTIITADGPRDPVALLDGKHPEDFKEFCAEIRAACNEHGYPAFLRTGHGSGKHRWKETCSVRHGRPIARYICNLVEWCHEVSPLGLPTNVWAVRDMIDTVPLFRIPAWQGFPVTREFRLFVFDGQIVHRQPYWPPAAIQQGIDLDPSNVPLYWRDKLDTASHLELNEVLELNELARHANLAVPGYWSVDILQDRHGAWWITDMAFGEESYQWDEFEEDTAT